MQPKKNCKKNPELTPNQLRERACSDKLKDTWRRLGRELPKNPKEKPATSPRATPIIPVWSDVAND